ncbi:MAG: hypothetical protein WCU88_05595 [Elusimicrobiota bacterium]|jgi:hypothetical protein
MPESEYDFEKLSREIVVSQFKGEPDAPAKTAALVKRTIIDAVRGTRAVGHPVDVIVRQIVAGAMGGLLLIDRPLPVSAVAMLRSTAEAAQEVGVDASEMMTWAMEGLSRVTPLVQPPVIAAIQEEIEGSFMGAGEVFAELCRKTQ